MGISKKSSALEMSLVDDLTNQLGSPVMYGVLDPAHPLVKDALADKPFPELRAVLSLLDKVDTYFRSMTHARTAVVVEREKVLALVMRLVVLEGKYLSKDFDKKEEFVTADITKKLVAHSEVKVILSKTKEPEFSYEDFQAAMARSTYPELSREVLRRMNKNPLIIESIAGPFDFNLDEGTVLYLPSKALHHITVDVVIGYDGSNKSATVKVIHCPSASPDFLKVGNTYKLAIDPQKHKSFLLKSQLKNKSLKISVRAPQVFVFPNSRINPLLTLESISKGASYYHEQVPLDLGIKPDLPRF